ncbi:MAG: HEAT repeat protein [Planctomycetota bacterium]|jgi:HEAT repeat protein
MVGARGCSLGGMLSIGCLLVLALAPLGDELEDKIEALQRAGTTVSQVDIEAVAELGSKASFEALVKYYRASAAPFVGQATLQAMARYSGNASCEVLALEFLTLEASGAQTLVARSAALETIPKFERLGRGYLRLLVEQPAPDRVRARALALHSVQADDEDKAWYRTLAAPKESRRDMALRRSARKGGKDEPKFAHRLMALRRTAFLVATDSYTDKALASLYGEEQDYDQRLAIVSVLAEREYKKAASMVKGLFESVDAPSDVRLGAARLLVKLKGDGVAADFVKLGSKYATPNLLRIELAALVAELGVHKVQVGLVKRIGKGKVEERRFVLLALRGYMDGKAVVRARKELETTDESVVAAAARYLGSTGQPEDVDPLRAMFESSDNARIVAATMRALTELLAQHPGWPDALAEHARGTDPLRAPLAVEELASRARPKDRELFLELLESPQWGTRLASMWVLAGYGDVALLGPIIERMQSESGRLRIEFGEALFELTAQPFGASAASWKAWYADKGAGFVLPSAEEVAAARVLAADREARERSAVARFFGIPVHSERVIFIIDVSGSMMQSLRGRYVGRPGEVRLVRAKYELSAALRDMPSTAQFNILAFSSGVTQWADRSVGAEEAPARDEALAWVSRLGAIGGTNLYGAMIAAMKDPHVDTIVLLSDGEPTVGRLQDPGAIRADIARRNKGRGIIIHTVSLGARLRTLEWLAEDSGGRHVLWVD